MKRIYYGAITLDVADEVAEAVMQLSALAAESTYRRFAQSMSQPFAVGRVERVKLSGFLNEGPESDVTLFIGAAMPLAVAQVEHAGHVYGTDETMVRLQRQIAEYGDDG